MSLGGQLQLKKITIAYCPFGGSSEGTRELIASKQWAEFKQLNPQVEVRIMKRGSKHPFIRAEYLHGNQKTICLRKNKADEVLERAQALRNSLGFKARSWVEKKRIVTRRPSIQGQWNPFFTFGDAPIVPNIQFEPVGDKYPRPIYQQAERRTYNFEPTEFTPKTKFQRLVEKAKRQQKKATL